MLGFQVLLLCIVAVSVTLGQVQPNLPLGLDADPRAIDLARAGFPGGRPLLPSNSQGRFQGQRFGPSLNGAGLGVGGIPGEVRTLNNVFENSGDGNYNWGFETSDGTRSEAQGVFKLPDPLNPEGVQAVQGSYSYISPEGIPISVTYIADENGFRAFGDHIPTNGNVNAGLAGFSGIRNRVTNPLGAQGLIPTQSPAILAAAAAGNGPAALEAALLRNPGNVELLAQQERLRLRNPYNNINNNRFAGLNPYNNQNQLGFQPLINGQVNPAFNPYANRGAAAIGAGVGVGGTGFGFRNRFAP